MTQPYIIAEAAQGFEGNVDVSKLLVRSAAKAGASAIKFQCVYADDLAEKGYEYYDLFRSLEMPVSAWQEIRELCRTLKIDFILDIFGTDSLELARTLKPEGIKIHSTCFFDREFIRQTVDLGTYIYLSAGGIELDEIKDCLDAFDFQKKENFTLMYGYQAEPTPIESNNLGRIPALRRELGISSIGFMDHSDGDSVYTETLSAVALGLGVRVFEKHITLDRQLEMEDYVSALSPRAFSHYVTQMKNLSLAVGSDQLSLTEAEQKYRGRAIKRVVASADLTPGTILDLNHIKLSRASDMKGAYKLEDILNKKLTQPLKKGQGIEKSAVAS
ncbi:MAG: N-acetylneuraminate synthase family protein [Alphaproteobacteria bacterium]|nr:N-acetylneuraminate synthase family protein [Alphaproteobacteria bacterium]